MAGNLSDYAESKVLDHLLGGPAFAQPSSRMVALFTTDPGEAGAGIEVVDPNYARQNLGAISGSGSSRTNAADIIFPVASVDQGEIAYIAVFDAVSGGNMLWHGPAAVVKDIQSDDQYVIDAGELSFGMD